MLDTIPSGAVYALTGIVIMVESMGIPVPGEVMLVASSLLASGPHPHVSVHGVAIAATAGAVVGDSFGYVIGRRYGDRLFVWLGRKFPHHVNDDTIAFATYEFHRHGVWAVFFGRFIALLRIFAGPLAGSLRMAYPRFLAANFLGAATWAGGTAYGVYALGQVAEKWMKNFSYIALVIAIVVGVLISTVLRQRVSQRVEAFSRARAEGRVGDVHGLSDADGQEPTSVRS